jgi:hypothetical protein
MATIPEPKDVFVGELAQNGDWIVASINTSMAWPQANFNGGYWPCTDEV